MTPEQLIQLLESNPELRKKVASYLLNDMLDELTALIRREIESYAEKDPTITRRTTLKILGSSLLLAGAISPVLARTVITDRNITIDGKEVVLVPPNAQDGQLIVRSGNEWIMADPSVDKWAGQQLTPRDITQDIQRLSESTLAYFKAFRVFTPNFFKPLRTFNLYVEIPSDSASEVSLEVKSGSGSSSSTVEYVEEGEIAWVESAGLAVEFSTSPDITWNSGKYIYLSRKHHPYGSTQSITSTELYGGQSDALDNWRLVLALSESVRYIESNKITSKSHAHYDFIAQNNYHYWFRNEQGDEYIKLSADAGCFTYTSDKAILYMKGMVFSVEDILATP